MSHESYHLLQITCLLGDFGTIASTLWDRIWNSLPISLAARFVYIKRPMSGLVFRAFCRIYTVASLVHIGIDIDLQKRVYIYVEVSFCSPYIEYVWEPCSFLS